MKKTVWALEDDRMGSVGQIKGVLQALDQEHYQVVEKKIAYTRLAKLPNCLKGASMLGLTSASKKQFAEPFPTLVISGSRRTAPLARWIKKRSHGHTKIIQLMHPGRCGLKDFDLVFVSQHDAHKKGLPNFRYMIGSPHRITEAALSEARALWQDEFKNLPQPLTAVIVGGSIKGKEFSLDNAHALGRAVKHFVETTGGSVLITTSRRTGSPAERAIMSYLQDIPHHQYLWGNPGVNPIMGYWACAERIIVTGDSVSMTSESCGTGKPVFVFTGINWLTEKHQRFVQSLYDAGYAAPLAEQTNFQPVGRLDPAAFVSAEINKLFS